MKTVTMDYEEFKKIQDQSDIWEEKKNILDKLTKEVQILKEMNEKLLNNSKKIILIHRVDIDDNAVSFDEYYRCKYQDRYDPLIVYASKYDARVNLYNGKEVSLYGKTYYYNAALDVFVTNKVEGSDNILCEEIEFINFDEAEKLCLEGKVKLKEKEAEENKK